MERFVAGDVVVIPFPFSDLSGKKRRPSLIIKKIAGNDYLLCQITHSSYHQSEEIKIEKKDFERGGLRHSSFIRFTKVFSTDESLIEYKIGSLKKEKMTEVITKICAILKS